jgi:SAM-dependent methyltransferase
MAIGARIYTSAAEENRRAILRMLEPRPGGVLLDVGCADGRDTVPLIPIVGASRTIGLELDDQFLETARSRGIELIQADITKPWPLEDASIDVVHSNQVIEHLAQTDHFVREIRRVLKADGYAVVSTNNLASWHNVLALVIGWQPLPSHVSDEVLVGNPLALEEARYGEHIHRHLRIFTGRALSALAEAHGLALDRAIGSGYYPFGPRAARVMARLDPRHAAYLVQRFRPNGNISPAPR